jgi:DNA-binding PadR family transcriptional regulator
MILFHLANQGPMHGYGLAAEIEKRGGWKPSQTSIYNALKALKAEGLVVPEEKIENGRAQIVYSLTDLGKERYVQHKQKMQNASLHNIQQMMTILEGITEEGLKKEITDVFTALRQIPPRIFAVLKVAPKKTLEILNGAIESINKLAKEKNIDLSKIDKDPHEECD